MGGKVSFRKEACVNLFISGSFQYPEYQLILNFVEYLFLVHIPHYLDNIVCVTAFMNLVSLDEWVFYKILFYNNNNNITVCWLLAYNYFSRAGQNLGCNRRKDCCFITCRYTCGFCLSSVFSLNVLSFSIWVFRKGDFKIFTEIYLNKLYFLWWQGSGHFEKVDLRKVKSISKYCKNCKIYTYGV